MVKNEIKLKIHEEADLFSPLDPDHALLSDDVSAYLVRNYQNLHRQTKESFTVHIFSDEPVNEERVRNAIRRHCETEAENVRHLYKLELRKEICLAILGLMLLSLWFFLSRRFDSVWMEVLSIMGWVAIWEATSIAIMRQPELVHLKRTCKQAANSNIIFDVVGGDEAWQ